MTHVTWHNRKWAGSDNFTRRHLEVAVEGRKLGFCELLSSCNAVTRSRWCYVAGNDVTWPCVTWSDPEVMLFHRKSPRSGCKRCKTRVLCTFELLQGCISQEVAVTWQEMTLRDLALLEVTRKWRQFTGSHLEVAVGGWKLGIVYFWAPTGM